MHDSLYKYRGGKPNIEKLPYKLKITKINTDGQITADIKGATFPFKTVVDSETLQAIGIVKSYIVGNLKAVSPFVGIGLLFSLFSKKYLNRVVDGFLRTSGKVMDKYILNYKHLTTFSQELMLFLVIFFDGIGISKANSLKLAEIVTHLLEYDDAYRLMVQDLLTDTTKIKLYKTPIREIQRLLGVVQQRANGDISGKFKKFGYLIRLFLVIPRFKKVFKLGIENVDMIKLQLDDTDFFWSVLQGRYKTCGLTHEERLQIIKNNGWKMPIKKWITF